MIDMDEETLIAQMKCGNQHAFAQIYDKYKASVYRTACLISGNPTDGEDIMQETFIKVFVHCKELRSNHLFHYWLFKILNRTAWQLLHDKKTEFPDESVSNKADIGSEFLTEDTLLQKEQHNELYQAVMQLDYKLRIVVVLYYYNEISTKQIASIVGCHEGTIKSRLFTARKRLKQLLSKV